MNDDFIDFMRSDSWDDYRQNKRLRGLEADLSSVSASLASARSSQRRLHSELSNVRGSLEQRLNRLSAAFDAFVEISDLRVTLGLFDAQGRVRHQARRLLTGEGAAGEVSDVDAYWLAPALVALRVAADGVADTDSLALARARDAQRATVFHVLGTGLLGGRGTVSAETLADALPAPGTALPRYERAVWTLAADGFFGESGWELARRRGVEFVRALPDEARAAAVSAVRSLGTAGASSAPLPRELEGVAELGTALSAAAGLSALRAWVESALAAAPNEPAAEVDPEVLRVVELLVDEGSPVELPLLARERELRAVIEGTGDKARAWDGPAGETIELLRKDAADSARPGRRAAAVRILGDLVLAAADRLAATARTDAPFRVEARTRQGTVTITPDGPDTGSVARLRSRIDAGAAVSGQRRVFAGVALAVAAVFLVLAGVAGWGWLVIGLTAPLVAAYQWRVDVRERREATATAAASKDKLAKEIDGRVAALADCRARLKEAQPRVDEDLKALREALA
ncbi:MAG: hypothetical protein ACRDSK_26555 [Actinophytocola sp.]|uniref:hypothetical protein n=1 Tax=Actinophytocola sp. TaxID=1872138 RepID=UPI003D6C5DA5